MFYSVAVYVFVNSYVVELSLVLVSVRKFPERKKESDIYLFVFLLNIKGEGGSNAFCSFRAIRERVGVVFRRFCSSCPE